VACRGNEVKACAETGAELLTDSHLKRVNRGQCGQVSAIYHVQALKVEYQQGFGEIYLEFSMSYVSQCPNLHGIGRSQG